jgi:hypothetical protein
MSRLIALLAGRIGQPYPCTPGAPELCLDDATDTAGAATRSSDAALSATALGRSPLTRETLCDGSASA